MTALDIKARALALKLLTKFGKAVTYVHRAGGGSYADGVFTDTETTVTPKVYIAAPTKSDIGNGVLSTEMTCLLAASAVTFEPTALDRITVGTKVFSVRPVAPIYSGEEVALWILGLTKT